MTTRDHSIVLAAYGAPGILAAEQLFGLGYLPEQVGLLTHASDERNSCLLAYAEGHGIAVCQTPPSEKRTVQWMEARAPEVLFSIHYRERIPAEVLRIPRRGGVNLHPSLLPKYRGCFSVPWAIIEGEHETGFSYHVMTERFDEGNILLQGILPIGDDDTAFALFHRQIAEGLAAFPEALRRTLAGETGTPQQGTGSYYGREVPHQGRIDPAWDRALVGRFIRALAFPPYPPAMMHFDGALHPVASLAEYDRLLSLQS